MKSCSAMQRTKSRPAGTPVEYAAGHFTALMRAPSKANASGFPPRFEPQYRPTATNQWGMTLSEVSAKARQRRVELGETGTIVGGLSRRSAGAVNKAARAQIARSAR